MSVDSILQSYPVLGAVLIFALYLLRMIQVDKDDQIKKLEGRIKAIDEAHAEEIRKWEGRAWEAQADLVRTQDALAEALRTARSALSSATPASAQPPPLSDPQGRA